jgi:hypothetical protein
MIYTRKETVSALTEVIIYAPKFGVKPNLKHVMNMLKAKKRIQK